jgi:copper homeostasis protein
VVSANGLILTPPVPQTLDLLEQNKVALPDNLRRALREVAYSQCIAVYGVFTGDSPLPSGGVWLGDGPIEWIVDNHLKGVSSVPFSITALTRLDWAAANWATSDEQILEQLLPCLQSWVGRPADSTQIWLHRWSWAQPIKTVVTPCAVVRDHVTVLAGDGFAGAVADPADRAILSGEAAAVRMAALLTGLARRDPRYRLARPRRYTLEIAVTTPEEASLADDNGADRLEVSSGLELGGLTPSLGLFRMIRDRTKLPLYVLLRPRSGGFEYTSRELIVMVEDARMFMEAGANGIVFGVLTTNGRIDRRACERLATLAPGRAVFHRAFDFLKDQLQGVEELIHLGISRVLTSGGGSTAEAGATHLTALVQHAGWQIEVVPAGDIRPHNVADLVRETRCDQVHSSARAHSRSVEAVFGSRTARAAAMGGGTELRPEIVAGLRAELDRLTDSLS